MIAPAADGCKRLLAGLFSVSQAPSEGVFVRVSKNRISRPRIEKGPNSPRLQCVFERARLDPIASCRVSSLVYDSRTARDFGEHYFPVRSLREVLEPSGNLVSGVESAVQKVVAFRIPEKALDQIVGHESAMPQEGRLRLDTGPMRRGECVYSRAST